jgi:hypothetical protein
MLENIRTISLDYNHNSILTTETANKRVGPRKAESQMAE